MNQFKIKVADCTVAVETLHVRPRIICEDYITDGEPDFYVRTSQEDIDAELARCLQMGRRDDPSDSTLEVTAVLRKVSEGLLHRGVFLMHGALIMLDGRGYLFTGKSGMGKTTHIQKWLENRPDAVVINGDKPFIRPGKVPLAYGTPWSGKERLGTNMSVPLTAIIIMERCEDNIMHPLTFADAFPMLCQQTYRPKDTEKAKQTVALLKSLENSVKFYRFQFNNFKDDVFKVAYNALRK